MIILRFHSVSVDLFENNYKLKRIVIINQAIF